MAGPRKINKGQRLAGIPADGWNGFVDTHHKVQQQRQKTNGPGQSTSDDRSVVVVLRNDSGNDVPHGGVLKLGDPIVTPATRAEVTLESLMFICDTPSASDSDQHVAIACEPIADGEIGAGFIPNAAWAKVNVSNAAHTFAKPKASVAELESDASTGFPIIWKETGTGSGKWAVVSLNRPGGSSLQLFKATSTISAATGLLEADRGSGTVQPLVNATGVADGDPITISNPGFDSFASLSVGWMNKSTDPPLIVSVFCTESS